MKPMTNEEYEQQLVQRACGSDEEVDRSDLYQGELIRIQREIERIADQGVSLDLLSVSADVHMQTLVEWRKTARRLRHTDKEFRDLVKQYRESSQGMGKLLLKATLAGVGIAGGEEGRKVLRVFVCPEDEEQGR